MKKIPLYFGLFLIVVWGASKKIASSIEGDNKTKKEQQLTIIYLGSLNESLDLSTLSRDEFYRIFRPQLSELVSDKVLYEAYEELKRQKEGITTSKH